MLHGALFDQFMRFEGDAVLASRNVAYKND